jgi:hypothetical protein
MLDRATIRRHADLVDRMAEAVGADLQAAVLDGRLRPDALADAVIRCTGCCNPEHCGAWLDAHPEGPDAPVGYCRNAELLTGLAGPGR